MTKETGAGNGFGGWEMWVAPRRLRWRVLLTILGPIAWLCFTLLYVGFWARGFSLFQDIVVILVVLLLLGAVVVSAWVSWGMHRFRSRAI
jgi:hypothetical protein